jgi:RNA polymerase sigma factor (sigma-70 family)
MTVTPDQSDSLLLQEFAAHRSQDAFTELVSRHSNWVYSAAARMVRDPHLAEDVAQAVFLVLADKAGKLKAVPLHRWLFKVTRYASANAIRARARRDKYERRAAMSTSEIHESNPDQLWQEIAPILDDSMNRLRSADRDALLMRFYQQKSVADVGTALGVSEGAAKVRVLRAIEKLRTILRRRGINAPTDTLGMALLVHTTHAAPATFVAGCMPASASIKATAISKGVSIMTFSTKIKIAAALLLVGGVSVGAGAYYLTSSSDRPEVAAQPAPAPAVVAPADTTYGLDPRVAPFVTRRTDILMAIDLNKLDLDAVAADMLKELSQSQMDAPSAAHINGMIQMGLGVGKQWINGFEQAGGTSMFLACREDQFIGGDSMHFSHATIVFPADSVAAAKNLARFLRSSGSGPLTIVGTTVVINPPVYQPSTGSDSRPALAAGLSTAGDMPIRTAVNPLKLKEIMPKLMGSAKGFTSFTGHEWDTVESCSINLVLPPAESPGFVIISHHKDPASAETGKSNAAERIDRWFNQHANTNDPVAQKTWRFILTEKFAVRDSDVVTTMDLHAYWDLLFTAVRVATQPPTSQPQRPAN